MKAKRLICGLTIATVLLGVNVLIQPSSQAFPSPTKNGGGVGDGESLRNDSHRRPRGEEESLQNDKPKVSFGCSSDNGKVTLYVKTLRGDLAFLGEGEYFTASGGTPLQGCEEIASRFQLAYDQEKLNYLILIPEEGKICASKARECDLVLFSLGTNAKLAQVLDTIQAALKARLRTITHISPDLLGFIPTRRKIIYIGEALIALNTGEGTLADNRPQGLVAPLETVEDLQKQILLYRQGGDRRNEAITFLSLGETYASLNQFDKSQETYNKALAVYQQISDRRGEADTLRKLGNLYADSLHNRRNGLRAYENHGLPLLPLLLLPLTLRGDGETSSTRPRSLPNPSHLNRTDSLGTSNELTSDISPSQQPSFLPKDESGLRALPHGDSSRTENKLRSPFTTRTPIPRTVLAENSYAKILEFRQQALTKYKAVGDRLAQAEILNDIGATHQEMGQYTQALASYQTALNLSPTDQEKGDFQRYIVNESKILNNIGEINRKQGKYSTALDFYDQALSAPERFTQSLIPEQGFIGDGIVLGEGIILAQNTPDLLTIKGAVLNNIGLVHTELGQDSLAIQFYNRALRIRKASGDLRGEGTTRHNLGLAYDQLQQNDKAIQFYQEALVIRQKVGDARGEALTQNNLALAYNKQNQPVKALELLRSALTTFEALGDRPNIGNTLDSIATVHKSLKQYPQALDGYQRSIQILQEVGDLTTLGIVRTNLGDLYEKMGDKPKAIASYRQAIDENIETILADLKGEELQAAFSAKHADTYARLINLLWDSGQVETAFNYVERAKARAFLNQMAGGPVNLRAGADTTLLRQEQTIRAELTDLNTQIKSLSSGISSEADKQTITTLKSKLDSRQQDYAQLLAQLNRQNAEAADLVSVNPAKLTDIQPLLDQNTTLVEYFVTDARTLAFLVTRNGVKGIPLGVGRAALGETVQSLYEYDFATLQDPHPASLKQLHQWLIQPLQSQLSTPNLIIVPHNVLHYLPFSALTDGQKFLIDDYALSTLPSANVMRFLAKKHKPDNGTLMAFGNPTLDLFYAGQEAQAIAGMYNTKALVGSQVTKTELLARSAQAGILHLATHGEFNSTNPLFSALLLTPSTQNRDSRLEVHEIYGMNLTEATNLVVLSACQSQVGKLSRGDELIGLNRAFLYAGSPNILASLWNIDDKATEKLMQKFYTYTRQGMGKAEALQKAQRELRAEYPHPYYWAAFVLTGSGR